MKELCNPMKYNIKRKIRKMSQCNSYLYNIILQKFKPIHLDTKHFMHFFSLCISCISFITCIANNKNSHKVFFEKEFLFFYRI